MNIKLVGIPEEYLVKAVKMARKNAALFDAEFSFGIHSISDFGKRRKWAFKTTRKKSGTIVVHWIGGDV